MTGPFQGRILVRDHVAVEASAFRQTDWDTDVATLPGMTVFAFLETEWDTDTAATTPVIGFRGAEDNWA